MKRWISLLVLVLAMVGLGTLIAWRLGQKKAAVAAQAEMRDKRMKAPPLVSVAPAAVRDIVHIYEAVGTVEAPQNVKIAAKITGRISYLEAREGDAVVRGQALARIDPSELQAQVLQKRAAVAQVEHRLAQARIGQKPTDTAVTTQVRQQEAALASARANANQVSQNYASQVAAAESAVTDVEGRVANAEASIANAHAAIQSATASLENARTQHQRITDLYKEGFIALQDVDNTRTALKVQEAAVEVARGQLRAATAQRDSALAQKKAAERQADIVRTKGKADIEAARAQMAQVKAALDYAHANMAQTPAYQENLGALQADVAAARATLANAEALLAETEIRSPLAGFVTGRYLDPGAVATPGQPILAVQEVREVWVTVPVPEEVSAGIRVGKMGNAKFDGIPGRMFSGKVVQVNPAADAVSRQFVVRFLLNNAENLIKPGMFARVAIETQRVSRAVVVPREAVQRSKAGPMAIVVDDEMVAHERPVTTGAEDTNGIAITSGVQAGEKVVVMVAGRVKDGQTVRLGGSRGGAKGRGGERESGGMGERGSGGAGRPGEGGRPQGAESPAGARGAGPQGDAPAGSAGPRGEGAGAAGRR